MDIIFYNGKINTLDEVGTVGSAVATTSGIIMAIGSDEESKKTSIGVNLPAYSTIRPCLTFATNCSLMIWPP